MHFLMIGRLRFQVQELKRPLGYKSSEAQDNPAVIKNFLVCLTVVRSLEVIPAIL
jgi:hypothetical protein